VLLFFPIGINLSCKLKRKPSSFLRIEDRSKCHLSSILLKNGAADFRYRHFAFRGAALSLLFALLMRGLSFAAISRRSLRAFHYNQQGLMTFILCKTKFLLIRKLPFECIILPDLIDDFCIRYVFQLLVLLSL
jgi:hypothetical protein